MTKLFYALLLLPAICRSQRVLVEDQIDYKYQRKEIDSAKAHTQTSQDKGFAFFYRHPKKIDRIMKQKGFSKAIIIGIITKEEVAPLLDEANRSGNIPDWNRLDSICKRKYRPVYVEEAIIDGKIKWYAAKSDWNELIKYNVEKIQRYGLDTAGANKYFLNDMFFNVIFLHCSDKRILIKSIEWMKQILVSTPDWAAHIDTYANLLYKIGRVHEALELEQRAVLLDEAFAKKWKVRSNQGLNQTLEEMKEGKPTWVQ
jgi:hypothetical protein